MVGKNISNDFLRTVHLLLNVHMQIIIGFVELDRKAARFEGTE